MAVVVRKVERMTGWSPRCRVWVRRDPAHVPDLFRALAVAHLTENEGHVLIQDLKFS
jgi:hypothetical protein